MKVWTGAANEPQRGATFFAKRVDEAVGLIDAAICELELVSKSNSGEKIAGEDTIDGSVFIVQGHDNAHKFELMRLGEDLERACKRFLNPLATFHRLLDIPVYYGQRS